VRVALVSETFLPAVNGVVNSVVRVADHLVSRGHEAVVLAPTDLDEFATPAGHSIPVIKCPRVRVPGYPGLSMVRPGVDLRPLLAEVRPDVVHLASPLVLGWAGACAANDLNLPAVAVFQTDMSGFLRRYGLGVAAPALWSGLRSLHNRTSLTLAPSTSAAYQLRAHGIGPVAIWGRGVDGRRFNPRHRSEQLNRDLGGVGTLVVGFVGRLAAEKRVQMLEPATRLRGVRVVIVGDGPKRRSLERRMPRATFLGLQRGVELSRLMASMDLIVNPGADETFCQVIQEALASGVPVISAAAGGPLDLIRHGDNGWLWSGPDPSVLAAQIDSLRLDRDALRAAALRARPSVVRRTWQQLGDELIGHYGRVLTSHQSGQPLAPGADVVPIRSGRITRLGARAS
jgi:phosphatidylinositol alpha 1,6-mannosyltransferase